MNDDPKTFSFLIEEGPPTRLDRALTSLLPEDLEISRSRVSKLIKGGYVSLQGKVITIPKTLVYQDQELVIRVPESRADHIRAEKIDLDIVYEDTEIIVINKPAGMVVHPGAGNHTGTLVNALAYHCGHNLSNGSNKIRPGIVHRLDKDTTGLMVVAKTDRAMHSLTKQFSSRTAKRVYHALIKGVPTIPALLVKNINALDFEPGDIFRISANIGRDPSNRKRFSTLGSGGKTAITRFQVMEIFQDRSLSLIKCWLETGRTHQIRVHMEYIGYPIIGDQVYGQGQQNICSTSPQINEIIGGYPRQALHAGQLELIHPKTREKMVFEADLPKDLERLVSIIR